MILSKFSLAPFDLMRFMNYVCQEMLTMPDIMPQVMHPYNAETDFELSLSAGDCCGQRGSPLTRMATSNGWAGGECKGRAGWFPFGYIEGRERVLASKIA
ncbi:unnamed protein product [Linum tenue]|uniref:Uncharacterized protein n=1 Tax=Linum tenue TaxID=586396 RepID=A0AAV0H0U7_9ROSI|nr:unnamed protein product [Linum tenue]